MHNKQTNKISIRIFNIMYVFFPRLEMSCFQPIFFSLTYTAVHTCQPRNKTSEIISSALIYLTTFSKSRNVWNTRKIQKMLYLILN